MPHRDPDTGQFLPHSSTRYDDVEVATWSATFGLEASNHSGNTGFNGGDRYDVEGIEVIDYDEFVDRDEDLRLLSAQHRMFVCSNSTQTADGTVVAAVEVSSSPAISGPTQNLGKTIGAAVDTDTGGGASGEALGRSRTEDTIDIIGRPLGSMAGSPFSDGSSGAGGGGSAGEDSYQSEMFPAESGRFHPRDELFVNGQVTAWNIDDAGSHVAVGGQHVYGVLE